MKFLIVSLALVAVAAAQREARIVKQAQDIAPDGTYTYSYETDNGIAHSETGTLEALDAKSIPAIVARGQYHYTSPDGTPIAVSYVADHYGFHPVGDHIHPIPPLIQKALDYISANPPQVEHK